MFWLHNKFPIELASLVKMPEYKPRPHEKNSANIQPSLVTLGFVKSSGLLGKYVYIYIYIVVSIKLIMLIAVLNLFSFVDSDEAT